MIAPMKMFESFAGCSTSVRGPIVTSRSVCTCGATEAVIGSSAGPHHAFLICNTCDRHRGWVSGETYNFITNIINNFGKPTEPIIVRFKNSRMSADAPL